MKKLSVMFCPVVAYVAYLSLVRNQLLQTTPPVPLQIHQQILLLLLILPEIPFRLRMTPPVYIIILSIPVGTEPIHFFFLSDCNVMLPGLMDQNTTFDSANNSNLNGCPTYNLLLGWQIGLPKIGVGGHIQLFIPSALAWGCTGMNGPLCLQMVLCILMSGCWA